jgi:O-antigen ligase
MLSFAVMMGLLTLQMLDRRRGVAMFCAAAVLVLSGLALYSLSDPHTRMRLSTGITEAQRLESESDQTASLPLRYHMARNTLQIFAEQPFLGVGAGDFHSAYEQMKNRQTPSLPVTRNPHNEILFAAATTGVLGLLSLAAIWFLPPWIWRHQRDELSALRIGLPVFYLMICLSESYLWLPNTGLMFVLFMSVLYGPPKPVGPSPASNPVPQPRPPGTTS